MSWRTIVISNRCKLDLKMGYMVIRSEETQKIFLDEIYMLMIENTGVSLTGCLIAELTRRKIKVIFCDEKRNPSSELLPLYGSHDCSLKIRNQIQWSNELKAYLWTEIVVEKIRMQAFILNFFEMPLHAKQLEEYICEIEVNDESNREGHAAKVYFNAMFGMDFTRSAENVTNAALNYGYSLILSAVNREVCANGYLTQIGLFHNNMFNHFNLSCDLMEVFRVIVDKKVKEENFKLFETEQKHKMLELFSTSVKINGTEQFLGNAIKIYCKSVFDALSEKDVSLIKFYRL